jgi:hypothetical protein
MVGSSSAGVVTSGILLEERDESDGECGGGCAGGRCAGARAERKPASPEGFAATQVGGTYVKGADEDVYQGGKWIEISYGRPIKRGRDLWGSGTTCAGGSLAIMWDKVRAAVPFKTGT